MTPRCDVAADGLANQRTPTNRLCRVRFHGKSYSTARLTCEPAQKSGSNNPSPAQTCFELGHASTRLRGLAHENRCRAADSSTSALRCRESVNPYSRAASRDVSIARRSVLRPRESHRLHQPIPAGQSADDVQVDIEESSIDTRLHNQCIARARSRHLRSALKRLRSQSAGPNFEFEFG